MELQGKQVVVVGAGISGVAACRFLLSRGAAVTLSDSNAADKLPAEAQQLLRENVDFLTQEQLPSQYPWHLCIKSPGVPPEIPLLQAFKARHIPIWGELELAWRYARAPFIAITGTNGKTTTTSLIGYILQQAGYHVLVAGNIGEPLIKHVDEDYDYIVAETSSFQLEDTLTFHPRLAVFMNFTPDHLNRHHTLENYLAAKRNIVRCQEAGDVAVLNYDDAAVRGLSADSAARPSYFSLEQALEQGAYVQDEGLYLAEGGQITHVMATADIYIKGRHNWQNALAALLAARALGITTEQIAAALRAFPGVEHRLEFVCEKDGVSYVNDSKGTNPDSTEKALLSLQPPLVLIAGGYDKGADFASLMLLIKERVRHLVVVGQTADKLLLAAQQAGFTAVSRAADFDEAVALASAAARPGDTVLLSPACAAWDMFINFEYRGRRFKELVLAEAK